MAHVIEGGFAIFAFADLQEGGFRRGHDRVALRIDQVEAMGLAGDLAPQDEAGFAAGASLPQGRGEGPLHCHAEAAHVVGRLEQVAGREQIMALVRWAGRGRLRRLGRSHGAVAPIANHRGGRGGVIKVQIPADPVQHRLGGAEVARRHQHEQPIRGGLEHMELAVAGDVIHPRIGAAVGYEHQAALEQEANAIGHAFRLQLNSRCKMLATDCTAALAVA